MQKQTRIRVTDIVGQLIDEEAIRDPRATAKRILVKVRGRLDRVNNDDPLPDERSIQKRANTARKLNPDAANLWGLNMSGKETPAEALPDLLQVWLVAKAADVPFTIRLAQWVSALRFAVRGSPLRPINWSEAEELLEWSHLYAQREYASERTGHPMITLDLDAELAYSPRISALHRWLYEQAIKFDLAPPSGRDSDWETDPFSPDYWQVKSLMEQVDRECGGQDWYPQAISVTRFWLGEITESSHWQAVFEDMPTDQRRKSWDKMAMQLTKEVVAKAKELAQLENRDELDSYLSWEPTETLEAVGLR